VFEVSNAPVTILGWGELAKEQIDSSHPAFSAITNAVHSAERAQILVRQVGDELRRRRSQAAGE